jgi:hypothetical protein
VQRAASAVARTERVQFTSTSAEGWPDETCGRQPNLRHRLRGDGRSLGSVAGQRLGAQSGMGWDGDAGRELRQAARRQASLERSFLTMEPETAIRSRKRASRGESRQVYASTFVAGRREVALDAKTARANERARANSRDRGWQTRAELVADR